MDKRKNKYYWDQVTIEENGMWKCKKCGITSSGGAKRIRAHIKRTLDCGIAPCSIDQVDGLHHNLAFGSSNPEGSLNAVNSFQEGVETGLAAVHNVVENNYKASDEEINKVNRIVSDLQCEEDDVKTQLLNLESRGKKRKIKVEEWLKNLQDLKRRAGAMIHYSLSLFEIEKLTQEFENHKELKPLVISNEVVGFNFEQSMKKVLELLSKDDQVFKIGIYGMAGVGKTLLAIHVANEIKQRRTFQDVLWVAASNNPSVSQLQFTIASRIGLKLHENLADNEITRAMQLSLALEAKGKMIIIIDDVWEYIDLEGVGIPRKKNGVKVVFTSRLEDVCRVMDCSPNSMIKIEPLDREREEDWELFLLKLGHEGTPAILSPEIEEVGKLIVKICRGLPLAVSVMARAMKPILNDGIRLWRFKLYQLRKGEMGVEMERGVLEVLKRSYQKLPHKDMQKCFLECALSPVLSRENELIKNPDLKKLIIGSTMGERWDKVLGILRALEGHFLLVNGPDSIQILLKTLAFYIKKTEES